MPPEVKVGAFNLIVLNTGGRTSDYPHVKVVTLRTAENGTVIVSTLATSLSSSQLGAVSLGVGLVLKTDA